jgi:uncharacterized lipoprotein NlpE involved in copper resistance
MARTLAVVLTIALALLSIQPALAAPAPQEVTAGIYYSEPFTLPDGSEVDFTLFLASDGGAGFVTSLTDGSDSLTEYGYWESPEAGSVGVTLTGDDDGDYETPDLIIFEQDGDTLNALEFNTDFFGEESFSVTLAITEEEMAGVEADAAGASVGGMYASDAIIAEDGSVGVALLFLAEDGTAQGNINYFDGITPPDVQLGAWTDNEDGTITLLLDNMLQLSADGAEPVEMDEPVERVYEIGGDGELVGEAITLYPLTNVMLGEADATTLLFVSELLPSADTPGRVVSLALAEDGGAAMATDYLNDEEPVLELGVWEDNGDDTLTVTLTSSEDAAYDEPVVIVFAYTADSVTAIDYDTALYGEEGLTLTLVPDEEEAAASDVGFVSFSSEELPSADTPGLVITFIFYEDGSFEAASDYLNDEPAFVEYGTWEEDEDGNAIVTLTANEDGELDEAVVFTVVGQDDGSILAVNETLFGADGLPLQLDEE